MLILQITAVLIAICFICWAMAGKYLGLPPAMYGSIVMGISSVTLAFVSFFKGESFGLDEVSGKKYLIILIVSMINGLGVYFFSTSMQRDSDVGIFSSSVSAYMVVLSPIVGYFLYSEGMPLNKIFGLSLIVSGVFIATQN